MIGQPPKVIVSLNGREFEFQELCEYMAKCFLYLSKTRNFLLERYSIWEGMDTKWVLKEWTWSGFDEEATPVGPELYFSNARGYWTGFKPSSDMEYKILSTEEEVPSDEDSAK